MQKDVVLIKLGGSVVTHKERPMTVNRSAIDRILKSLLSVKVPIILVHGGGSFGHYWSVMYDIHSKPERYSSEGIALVHESMISLNHIMVKSMLKLKMNPYTVPPFSLILSNKPFVKKIFDLAFMAKDKIIPITYGDIVYRTYHKYSIMSGDELMTMISSVLRPKKVIFAINVDGIYKDPRTKEVVQTMEEKALIKFSAVNFDITGGMKRKVREALKISLAGMDVHFVNGFKPERLLKIIENKKTEGTVIRGKRSSIANA
ncbi:MAG TPA: isopentenyl phosphate kinase [Nitrososphaeraceae archaeon]|jgi:isopentenyl phosphate kinase|nr:isopentenyl phosphate kinase [Nitrososphaeraceae archaeon]